MKIILCLPQNSSRNLRYNLSNMSPIASKTKTIALLTYGSRGDVEPFIALGVALLEQGFSVRMAAPATFAGLVEPFSIRYIPIESNPDELAQAFADRAGLDWARMIREMTRHVLPLAVKGFSAVVEAAEGADMIIHSFLMTDAGHTLACLQGIPDISAQLFPVFLPTRHFPAVGFPAGLPDWGWLNWTMHSINTFIFRHMARLLYRSIWNRLPETSIKHRIHQLSPWPFQSHAGFQTPLLFAYSPALLPKPEDWPDYAHVTGYWRLPLPSNWTPPETVRQFLLQGPPPVYFGPGSMKTTQLYQILRMVVNALREMNQRIFLGVSPEQVPADISGPDLFAMNGLPHVWLFPKMRFILHHGGAGTTGAALSAGIPNSALPFSADQVFWQRQLYRQRVGPLFPSAQKCNPERLRQAFYEALTNPIYACRASDLEIRLRHENGLSEAVRVITQLFRVSYPTFQ